MPWWVQQAMCGHMNGITCHVNGRKSEAAAAAHRQNESPRDILGWTLIDLQPVEMTRTHFQFRRADFHVFIETLR